MAHRLVLKRPEAALEAPRTSRCRARALLAETPVPR